MTQDGEPLELVLTYKALVHLDLNKKAAYEEALKFMTPAEAARQLVDTVEGLCADTVPIRRLILAHPECLEKVLTAAGYPPPETEDGAGETSGPPPADAAPAKEAPAKAAPAKKAPVKTTES